MTGTNSNDDNDDEADTNVDNLFSRKHEIYKFEFRSAKMVTLLPLIKQKLEKNEKVIIVSSFLNFLDYINTMLENENIETRIFKGDTPVHKRDEIVKSLNTPGSDVKVLLLSINCGSLGLTLTGANNMFILDVYWNPQQELQVIDRIHRIGQLKTVTVVK